MIDHNKLLHEIADNSCEWTGNRELPTDDKVTSLAVAGKKDAEALLETIRRLGGPNSMASIPKLPQDSLGKRIGCLPGRREEGCKFD